jgi:HAD superfamily hydrolase (TIGR01509 family)
MKATRHSAHATTNGWRKHRTRPSKRADGPPMLFDLDGTLVDAVYEHVVAWHQVLQQKKIALPCWKIHRQIGLSGKSFLPMLFREIGMERDAAEIKELEELHRHLYMQRIERTRVLPGARELLEHLTETGIPWAIGTSGEPEAVEPMLKLLGVPASAPVVLAKQTERGKPNPDVFFLGAEKLGVKLSGSVVVGDSVWDLLAAQRAKALGVGLLSGGYGRAELEGAGAYRIYQDPGDLLAHLEELGVQEEI